MLRVVTVRCEAPRPSRTECTFGSAWRARPPAEAGFTRSANLGLRRGPARPLRGPRGRVRLLALRVVEPLVAEQALRVRLLEVVGVQRQEHVLLDAVPARLV